MDLETDPHVLAIGEALVDIVSPASNPSAATEIPGGSPANVAMTLGRLGRNVALQTWIGRDPRGDVITKHFGDSHVFITPESCGADRTPTALATLDENGAASYTFDLEWAPASPIRVADTARVVHAGSIATVIEPGGPAVLDALVAARQHAIITYDPNARPAIMGSPEESLATVNKFVAVSDVVKVSDEDIAWLTGGRPVEDVLRDWLTMGPAIVIVTRGKTGALAHTVSGVRRAAVPADVEVVDTVGAGDSFMGGIIDALWSLGLVGAMSRSALHAIEDDQVRAILDRASAISDITVSRAGANPPWLSELAGMR
ncbi:carbohydrate kinase [Schaalia naturae]|uniref:Carbohydrate kinase n=1 Tax=Schaalia naturae TaxID=635203 RepID=A0ABW2SMG1_9ACTO